MKYILMILICILVSCSMTHIDNRHYRVYQITDMEDLLQDYYTNVLGRISPGLACGDFKMENDVGCFKLLVDKTHGEVTKLIYHDLSSGEKHELYKFDPPANYVFIEKIIESKLATSDALPEHEEVTLQAGQPSLRLVFFGKSAVVFYWKNDAFHKIWTAD